MATAAKVSKTTKYQNIAERVKASTIGAGEPTVSKESYKIDLMKAMTYYHTYGEPKVMRKWVQKFVGKDAKKLQKIDQASDYELMYLAIFVRLQERDQYLEKKDIDNHITKRLKAILEKPIKEEDDGKAKQKASMAVSIAQRNEARISGIIGDIEGEIDSFRLNGYKTEFSPISFLAANKIEAVSAKKIGKWFEDRSAELEEAFIGKDPQLVEAYSHIPKAKMKKLIAFYAEIINACKQQTVVKIRKPRKLKVKAPSDIVKRMKYMSEEFAELKLTSLHPVRIVKAAEVWVFNTKARKLAVYKALDADGLSVKGSAIINFNTSSSEIRTLRKPEEWFKMSPTKKDYGAAWKKLTTKVSIPNGRVNSECIIVAAF